MTHKEFAELVRDMRTAQTEYFTTRDRDTLTRAKGLEARVDRAIKEVLDNQQPLLF